MTDAALPVAILACLIGLLVWTSRRWGRPRFYVRGVAALWLATAILGLVILWLALR